MDESTQPREDGFEYQGRFYTWHVSDMGKDLMLIDRFSGLPVTEFFEIVEDEHERGRGPIVLTLIATSLRNGHPDWSVERIVRVVMGMNLSDVEFISSDVDEETSQLPPAEAPTPASDGAPSTSPPNGSLSPSTPAASTTFETLSAIRP